MRSFVQYGDKDYDIPVIHVGDRVRYRNVSDTSWATDLEATVLNVDVDEEEYQAYGPTVTVHFDAHPLSITHDMYSFLFEVISSSYVDVESWTLERGWRSLES